MPEFQLLPLQLLARSVVCHQFSRLSVPELIKEWCAEAQLHRRKMVAGLRPHVLLCAAQLQSRFSHLSSWEFSLHRLLLQNSHRLIHAPCLLPIKLQLPQLPKQNASLVKPATQSKSSFLVECRRQMKSLHMLQLLQKLMALF